MSEPGLPKPPIPIAVVVTVSLSSVHHLQNLIQAAFY